MIHRLTENDRDVYIEMAREFYHSDAVLHPIPDEYFVRTVEEAVRSDAYAEIFLFECGGETAGYGPDRQKPFPRKREVMCGGSRRSISVKSFVPEVWEGSFSVIWKSRREKKLPRLRLEVEKENTRAVSLYERLGYEVLDYVQMVKDET